MPPTLPLLLRRGIVWRGSAVAEDGLHTECRGDRATGVLCRCKFSVRQAASRGPSSASPALADFRPKLLLVNSGEQLARGDPTLRVYAIPTEPALSKDKCCVLSTERRCPSACAATCNAVLLRERGVADDVCIRSVAPGKSGETGSMGSSASAPVMLLLSEARAALQALALLPLLLHICVVALPLCSWHKLLLALDNMRPLREQMSSLLSRDAVVACDVTKAHQRRLVGGEGMKLNGPTAEQDCTYYGRP